MRGGDTGGGVEERRHGVTAQGAQAGTGDHTAIDNSTKVR